MDRDYLQSIKRVIEPTTCGTQVNERKKIKINDDDESAAKDTQTAPPQQQSFDVNQILSQNTSIISEINDAAGKKRVLSVRYERGCAKSDFTKMVLQPSARHTCLFIMCENFIHQQMGFDIAGNGGGSAAIRKYTYPAGKDDGVFVIGIATGWSLNTKGFQFFGQPIKWLIDIQFKAIQTILTEHPTIQNVIFPCSEDDPKCIGSGIFEVSNDVTKYISSKLADVFLPQNMLSNPKSMDAINAAQTRHFDHYALALDCGTKLAKAVEDIMHAVPRENKMKIWRLLREWYSQMKEDKVIKTNG